MLYGLIDCEDMYSIANGESTTYAKLANLNLFPAIEVHFNPKSIANILLIIMITEKYLVTMNSNKEDEITIHIDPEKVLKFQWYGNWLVRL